MKSTALALSLVLACCGADAAPVATPEAATASAPASTPLRATRAASAACGAPGASRPMRSHVVTSKVRHIPVESDPCADTDGVAPPLPR